MAKKKIESKDKKLTVKQKNFCNYYIEEQGNASAAYRRAYKCERMKDSVVNVKASELLKNGKIMVRVIALQKDLQDRSDMTKDEAVKFLSHVVRANILDYVNIDMGITINVDHNKEEVSVGDAEQKLTVKDLSQLSIEQQRCIQSIAQTKYGIKVELCSKDAALTRLSKMLGWDEATKLETTITGGVNIDEWIKARAQE